jgi:hypothetical protein
MPEPLPADLGALFDIVQSSDFTVVLGLREDEKTGLRYRFVRADVEEGFRRAARESTVNALRRFQGATILQYDSAHLLEDKEVFKRRLNDAGLEAVADVLAHPAVLPAASFRDFDRKIDFYAFVYLQRPEVWAAFIRQAFQVHVSGIHKLIAVYRAQRLAKPSDDQRVLRFDDRFDIALDSSHCYVVKETAFDDLFIDRAEWQKRVPAQVDALIERGLPFANAKEFIAACQSNLNMMKKLKRIAESDYLDLITPAKVRTLVAEYGLSRSLVAGDSFVFDPGDRWRILKVLDDDDVKSSLTERRYETNSKVHIIGRTDSP